MSFHPITLDAKTWNESGPGRYMESTVVFGGPMNYIKISPGARSKSGLTSCAITRYFEKDVVVNNVSVRASCTITQNIQVQDGITVADIDTAALHISSFLDSGTLTRILNGER